MTLNIMYLKLHSHREGLNINKNNPSITRLRQVLVEGSQGNVTFFTYIRTL